MDSVFLQGFLYLQQNFFNMVFAFPILISFFGLIRLITLFIRK